MFEKFNQMAEELATTASRREFLNGLGKAAFVLAAAIAGVLGTTEVARADGYCAQYCKRQCGGDPSCHRACMKGCKG